MVAVIVIIIIMILPITTLAEPALPIIARKILTIFGTAVINVLFLSNNTTIHNNHTTYFFDDDSSSGKIIPIDDCCCGIKLIIIPAMRRTVVRVECLWTPCRSTGKIILTITIGVSIKYNSIDAQNKTNTTTRYMTFCIIIPLFLIMKILMPIIHYDSNTIHGRNRSIYTTVIYGRGCGRTINTTCCVNDINDIYRYRYSSSSYSFIYLHFARFVKPLHLPDRQSLSWPQ